MDKEEEKTPEQLDYRQRVEKYVKRCQENTSELKIGLVGQLDFKLTGISATVAFIDLKQVEDKKTVEDVIGK